MDKQLIFNGLSALLQLWINHTGAKPTVDDIEAMLAECDEATPEAVKAAARVRLGLPPV